MAGSGESVSKCQNTRMCVSLDTGDLAESSKTVSVNSIL